MPLRTPDQMSSHRREPPLRTLPRRGAARRRPVPALEADPPGDRENALEPHRCARDGCDVELRLAWSRYCSQRCRQAVAGADLRATFLTAAEGFPPDRPNG